MSVIHTSAQFTQAAPTTRSCQICACSLPQRCSSVGAQLAPTLAISSPQCRLRRRPYRLQAMPAQATEEEEQSLPYGYIWYETMIILRPDLDDESRDMELAKFEAFLQKEGAVNIDVLVRPGSQQLAYPIKGYWEGIYVLYFYAASPKTAQGVQKTLSLPPIDSELNILRHMTFRQ